MNIGDKRVLLTGATGGIGIEMAQALAREGAQLMLTGRHGDKLETLSSSLPGEDHKAVVADLSSNEQRKALVDQAQAWQANMLINLAGVNQFALLPQVTDQQLAQLVAMNLSLPIQLCRDLIPYFRAQPEAVIVNVGSTLGSIGYAGYTVYCATKFGLRGFTEAMRRELADSSVQVLYFAPRATATSMNSSQVVRMNKDLGTAVDTPAKVAASLVAMLKRARPHSFYLGWPEKLFVRVNALLPALVDRALFKQLATIRNYAEK